MKTIELENMYQIQGGDAADEFCVGFGAVASVYAIGVLANWWNPIGWGGSIVGAIIGVGCAANAML